MIFLYNFQHRNYAESCHLSLLNLTTTHESFLLCDDVIISDVGLLLLIMINMFSVDDKHWIKLLREEKQYTADEFLREFPNKKWPRGCLNHLLEIIDKFGCVKRLAGSGRPRSTHNAENIESVCAQLEDRSVESVLLEGFRS